MNVIKIHKNESNNLCSIKFSGDYARKIGLVNLTKNLFNLTNASLYIEASRPNYEVKTIIDQLGKPYLNIYNLEFDSKFFELSFQYKKPEINKELLDILPEIWFAFEHVSFYFIENKEVEFNKKRLSWYEITSKMTSYVMFKGIETDVIWIGKSNNLVFQLEKI